MLHDQPPVPGWLAMPDEVEAQIIQWQSDHPDIVSFDTQDAFVGLKVYAITVTDRGVEAAGKKKMFVHVPHAHAAGQADAVLRDRRAGRGRAADRVVAPALGGAASRPLVLRPPAR